MPEHIDLLVIGGGPAGYCSAIRGTQLGKSVVLVEGSKVGGTCLNRGCIPTKSLLQSAELYRNLNLLPEHGINVSTGTLDFPQVITRKDDVVQRVVNGLQFLLHKKGIDIVTGIAKFLSPTEVQVGDCIFAPERIVVCTGTEPLTLPGMETDGKIVMNSDEFLHNQSLPNSLLIVGGGVIGCEFATVYSSFGVDVTIVELTERLLPTEDSDLSKLLTREFKKKKLKVLTNAAVKGITSDGQGANVTVERKGKVQELNVDQILISVGRRSVVPEGFPGEVSERGYITVNEQYRTTIDHIYAAGDVIGGLQLAHLAFEEGLAAVDFAFGKERNTNWQVPRCVYTNPEIAAVGLTEEEARSQYGDDLQIGKFDLKGNGKAVIMHSDAGFCKVIAKEGKLLGVHLIGPHATEMIAGGTTVLQQGISLDDWADVIHPHPTVSESIKESVLATLGLGLHSL